MQGILIEQDAARYLRYDLVHSGSGTFLFSASFAGGSAVTRGNRSVSNGAPFWISVPRTGDQWLLLYPTTANPGSTSLFSFSMQVAKAGRSPATVHR